MNLLEVKTYPEPCLRVKTERVNEFDDDLKGLVSEMARTMYLSQGIGLAAPQVGVGLRVFVMDTGSGLGVFVNPEIITRSAGKTRLEEGCLSLPGITVGVSRPEKIKVRAFDERGGMFVKNLSDLEAKAVQHEMDHLDGRLIIDYLDPVRHFLSVRELSSNKKKDRGSKCQVVCRVGKENK